MSLNKVLLIGTVEEVKPNGDSVWLKLLMEQYSRSDDGYERNTFPVVCQYLRRGQRDDWTFNTISDMVGGEWILVEGSIRNSPAGKGHHVLISSVRVLSRRSAKKKEPSHQGESSEDEVPF